MEMAAVLAAAATAAVATVEAAMDVAAKVVGTSEAGAREEAKVVVAATVAVAMVAVARVEVATEAAARAVVKEIARAAAARVAGRRRRGHWGARRGRRGRRGGREKGEGDESIAVQQEKPHHPIAPKPQAAPSEAWPSLQQAPREPQNVEQGPGAPHAVQQRRPTSGKDGERGGGAVVKAGADSVVAARAGARHEQQPRARRMPLGSMPSDGVGSTVTSPTATPSRRTTS
jgi:hypothetical protein